MLRRCTLALLLALLVAAPGAALGGQAAGTTSGPDRCNSSHARSLGQIPPPLLFRLPSLRLRREVQQLRGEGLEWSGTLHPALGFVPLHAWSLVDGLTAAMRLIASHCPQTDHVLVLGC